MKESPLKDFDNDPGQQVLHALAIRYEFPDYVKQASVSQFVNTKTAVASCAQITPEPRLPCHNKAATWLSYAYFQSQRNNLSKAACDRITRQLAKKAKLWGIDGDVERIKQADESLEKAARMTDEDFPLRNPAEISAAAVWLTDQDDLDISERVKLAGRLLDTGEPMPSRIWQMSCRRGCYDGRKVAKLLTSKSDNVVIKKLAAMCEQLGPAEMQEKHSVVAAICDKLAVFDQPAEIALAVNTVQPVVILSNNAVVRADTLSKCSSELLPAVSERSLQLRHDPVKTATQLTSDLADALIDDLKQAGLPIEFESRSDDLRTLSL